MTSPAFDPRELEVMGTLQRAWTPSTPLWIANGCRLSKAEVEATIKPLVARGAIAHIKSKGIDEHGLDYKYSAYILADRVSPWMIA